MRITLTIARQLGCGGSEIGRQVAQNLGFRCIDREIVGQTAKRLQLDEEELAAREEKVCSFWERMISGLVVGAPEAAFVPASLPSPSDQEIFGSETEVLKTIAAAENCVIVGRGAAHVLEPHAGMINILLYAPLWFRLQRVMEFYGAPDENQARQQITRSDGMRERFIAHMTGNAMMDARNYQLCLDSSQLPFSAITNLIADYARTKLGAAHFS